MPAQMIIQIYTTPNTSASSSHYSAIQAWRSAAFSAYGNLHFTKSGFRKNSEKFREEDMEVRMEGKNCVVTGANSGIGYVTAEELAKRGANVYMICRNKERGEAAIAKIRSDTGNQNVFLVVCDISSVGDVKSFVSRFSSMNQPLHVLVNNAGMCEYNRVTTSEGLEYNFALNVAGTFTLTELMIPSLEKAAPDARVITVSSSGMYQTSLTENLQFSESKFDGLQQYCRNKRVLVALTEKWMETYCDRGIGFYSMHPGWAVTPLVTNSSDELTQAFFESLRTMKEGADTVIWLALQPKEKLTSGAFYFDRVEAIKHLILTGTSTSHSAIESIVENLKTLCGFYS